MKKIFILLVAALFPLQLMVQMVFENAYIIDAQGNKKLVLIN